MDSQPFLLAQERFFASISKRHPYKLYECLSTIISMVLSVEVYYYMMKIITTFIIGFFEYFNSKSLELFDYIIENSVVYQICYTLSHLLGC